MPARVETAVRVAQPGSFTAGFDARRSASGSTAVFTLMETTYNERATLRGPSPGQAQEPPARLSSSAVVVSAGGLGV